MNTQDTEISQSFHTEQKPNGDVWIHSRECHGRHIVILIPQAHRRELAALLLLNSSPQDTKVDYSRCAGEPE